MIELKKLLEQDNLAETIGLLLGCVEFYAHEGRWKMPSFNPGSIEGDKGELARKLLEQLEASMNPNNPFTMADILNRAMGKGDKAGLGAEIIVSIFHHLEVTEIQLTHAIDHALSEWDI